ncbi:MAG: TonB family protein, partial [Pseudomonadota bacterium]
FAFVINQTGQIMAMRILRSSGHRILDKATQDTMWKINKFPPIPPEMQKDKMRFIIDMPFILE